MRAPILRLARKPRSARACDRLDDRFQGKPLFVGDALDLVDGAHSASAERFDDPIARVEALPGHERARIE